VNQTNAMYRMYYQQTDIPTLAGACTSRDVTMTSSFHSSSLHHAYISTTYQSNSSCSEWV